MCVDGRKKYMSTTTNQTRPPGRLWKVPTSRARWYWLGASILLFLGIFVWYLDAHKTQQYPGPLTDPLRLFGILAFSLVLGTATYSLRRRFIRSLPGKVQNWLWMHTWVGIITILIAMLHEDFGYITHDYCQNTTCLTDTYFAGSALFSLILLVISGITGRLLDIWSTHRIAQDANANGVGIAQSLIIRIKELEYAIERFSAGKSAAFKDFCQHGWKSVRVGLAPTLRPAATSGGLSSPELALILQTIPPSEHADLEQAHHTIQRRARLLASLKRQRRASSLMRIWRRIHIAIAIIALVTISYHGVMELLTNVWHVLPV
jgi:heme/copper-type cytochrome/quinol oxidase subunit 3